MNQSARNQHRVFTSSRRFGLRCVVRANRLRLLVMITAALLSMAAGLAAAGPEEDTLWTRMVERLAGVRTVKLVLVMEFSALGERQVSVVRCYSEMPGKARQETLSVPEHTAYSEFEDNADIPIDSIAIHVQQDGEIREAWLVPFMRSATIRSRKVAETDDGTATQEFSGFAEQVFAKLSGLPADRAKHVGERIIDGAAATGFEVSAGDVLGDADGSSGFLQVWIDKESALPMLLEGEVRAPEETVARMRTEEILYVDLPDDLFETAAPEGWMVSDATEINDDFVHKTLKPGVTLRAGPTGGPPLITEENVVSVSYRPEGFGDWSLRLRLQPRSADRLEAHASEHPDGTLALDFNKEMQIQVSVRESVEDRELIVPTASLEMSREEFEEKYLYTPEDVPAGAEPSAAQTAELVYRIDFSPASAGDAADVAVTQDVIDRFVGAVRLWLDEPGVQEVLWRDENLLVINIECGGASGMDADWARQAVEKFLDSEPSTIELLIAAEEEDDGADFPPGLAARTAELVAFLQEKEAADGGWPLSVDLTPLDFESVCDGRKIRCRWVPRSPQYLEILGLAVQPMNTIAALRPDYAETDGEVVSTVFRLLCAHEDREWRFATGDFASFEAATDSQGLPAIGFQLRAERQEDLRRFTRAHIKRTVAIVLNGMVISEPVIRTELPGGGQIEAPGLRGSSKAELRSLLALVRSTVPRFKYEFLRSR